MTRRVLIVDDEADLSELVAYNLRKAGFETRTANNGTAGLEILPEFSPDLVVLDVMMPGLTGYEVLARIRREPSTADMPVIMLTAKGEEADELEGLLYGADDYITKPFSMSVLVARIKAILRRALESRTDNQCLSLGPLFLDKQTHQAGLDEKPLSLTLTEFRLLCSLIEAGGKVLSRADLIKMAIGDGITITERTIDVHITSIRRKLGEHARLIKTVRGIGYRTLTETADNP